MLAPRFGFAQAELRLRFVVACFACIALYALYAQLALHRGQRALLAALRSRSVTTSSVAADHHLQCKRPRWIPLGRAWAPCVKRAMLKRLMAVWVAEPEQRLGRLVANAEARLLRATPPRSLYLVEDDELLHVLETPRSADRG